MGDTTKGVLKKLINIREKLKPVQPKTVSTHRERDMSQDAIDMGSHGASEYLGKPQIKWGGNDQGK